MTRSKWKIPYFNLNLTRTVTDKKLNISSYLLNIKNIQVYNGNNHQIISLNKSMLGFKLGEFTLNKKVIIHAKSLVKSKKKVQKKTRSLILKKTLKFLN